jgi:hypothetical protein
LVGNESERHLRYKRKVANVLRDRGFTVFGDSDDEVIIHRGKSSPPYYVDVCGCSDTRIIAVEIDGYVGHASRRRILRDKHRTDEIKRLINNIEIYRFAFWQLKGMDNETIALELGLKGRDNK